MKFTYLATRVIPGSWLYLLRTISTIMRAMNFSTVYKEVMANSLSELNAVRIVTTTDLLTSMNQAVVDSVAGGCNTVLERMNQIQLQLLIFGRKATPWTARRPMITVLRLMLDSSQSKIKTLTNSIR